MATDKCLSCGRSYGDPTPGCMDCPMTTPPAATPPCLQPRHPTPLPRKPLPLEHRPLAQQFVPRADLVTALRTIANKWGRNAHATAAVRMFDDLADELEKGAQ